ncbi:MAG: hypothetical protein KF901_20850 [Myxococcales bacterium]|nr:hypothetical protein [Myxococcales bacterium]
MCCGVASAAHADDDQEGPSLEADAPAPTDELVEEPVTEADEAPEDAEHDPYAAARVGGVSVYHAGAERRFPYDDRNHARMGVLRVGIALPFVLQVKYAEGPVCEVPDGADESVFCSRVGEPMIDLEAGFAVTSALEIVGSVAFALSEHPVGGSKPKLFGLGVRGYTSREAIVKGFFGGRLVLEHAPSDVDAWSNVDLGLRGDFGLQVDPVRWLGIFVQGAVGIRLLRGFSFLPEVSVGVQVRFP